MSQNSQGSGLFKRGRKGWGLVLATVMLVTIVLSGCSSSKDAEPSNSPLASAVSTPAASEAASAAPTAEAPKEIVELKAIFPGDVPVGMDAVLAAVNDKLKKDNIGASLKIQFIPWNDYGNLTNVKIASGEEFDMFLDAPWLHIVPMITAGSIIPLDDLVAKQPELQNSIPQQMWEANKFFGKIWGVPLGTTQGQINGFVIRQDLREQYGLPPIKTFDELEKFLYTVKEKNPEMIPFVADGVFGVNQLIAFNKNHYTNNSNIETPSVNSNYYLNANKILEPMWENSEFIAGAKETSKLYKDGIFAKNIAQEQNAKTLFNQGKAAATQYYADGVEGMKYVDALKLPGAKLEIVIPAEADWKPVSTFVQGNFLTIPKNSKHPELVMALMNWLSIKANHDLLEYGIEGTDWNAVGDTSYHPVSKYTFPGYVISWRPSLYRTSDTMLPDDKKWFTYASDANNFRPAELIGFTAKLDDIKTEIAKIDPLTVAIVKPIGNGVLDSEKGFKMLKEQQTAAGGDKVQKELQKQVDAYFAAKK